MIQPPTKTPSSGVIHSRTRALRTVGGAAEHYGLGRSYLYERIKAGEIPAIDLGNGGKQKLRIRDEDLEQFLESRKLVTR